MPWGHPIRIGRSLHVLERRWHISHVCIGWEVEDSDLWMSWVHVTGVRGVGGRVRGVHVMLHLLCSPSLALLNTHGAWVWRERTCLED